jgi:GNAT superfamily N-acetyltransferase
MKHKDLIQYIELLNRAFPKPPRDTPDIMISLMQNYKSHFQFIKKNNKIIAGVMIVELKGGIYGIEMMAVESKFQRKGYGKLLLNKVYEKFKGLFLLSTKRSVMFYKKLGFIIYKFEDERYYMFYANDIEKVLMQNV